MSFEQVPAKTELVGVQRDALGQENVATSAAGGRPPDRALAQPAPSSKASPTHTEMTGNSYADEGLGCKGDNAGGACILDEGTRTRVVQIFHGRVNAAQTAYMAAITQLGVEELLKKEPEQSEWMMDLILDVIGTVTSGLAVKMFKLMLGGRHGAIEEVAVNLADVSRGLSAHGDALLKEGVETAVKVGKKEILNSAGDKADGATPEAGTQKAANIAYLTLLQDRSGPIFEYFREGMIAGLDDASLLVVFDSFRAVNHTVSAYKAALSQKLHRFANSGLAKLGVSRNHMWGQVGSVGIDAALEHETHAFWVKGPTGVRLGLYKRAHESARHRVDAYDGSFTRETTPFEKLADEMRRGTNDEGFIFERFVESDLVEVAVHMHTAKWGYAPRQRTAGPYEMMQMGPKEEQR